MQKYKLIACDLDGTLVGSDLNICEKNQKALAEFAKMGVHFVPCTGRTLSEMENVVNNDDIRYYIYSNGAAIWDKRTDEKVLMCFPKDVSERILDILFSVDSYTVIHHDGKTYIDESVVEGGKEKYNLSYNVDELVKTYANRIADFRGLSYSMDNIESMSVFFTSEEDNKRCVEALSKLENVLVVKGWDCNIEIFSSAASKGKALEKIAEMLGIDISETITIGDSDNDRSMTLVSGLGLAASNAVDSLKKIADEVICSNDEGVADYVLKHYFG